jgi:outer membrane immunogenic protein
MGPLKGLRAGEIVKKLAFFGIMFLAVAIGRPAQAGGAWTGFYVGGNAGYAWGSGNSTLAITDGPNCHFCDVSLPGNDSSLAQAAGSPSFSPKGFTGGLQFGYNWQPSNWVYGIEIDFDRFSQSQTVNNSVGLPASGGANPNNFTNCTAGFAAVPCAGNFSSSVKTDWLITIRPRVGYSWDHTLVYATGGLAITKLSFSQTYSDNINFFSPVGGAESASASKNKVGWVIGAGLEQAVGNNWSLKAEYLYVRFDGLNATGVLSDGNGDQAVFTNNLDHLSSNIVRVGFNYKFGGAPLVAKY